LKTILTCLLNITIYGVVLPLFVSGMASLAITYSCKYYWGEEYLVGDSGFKLGMWVSFYIITLTLYYYFFAVVSFGFDHKLRKVSIALTLIMPILFHYLLCGYDYRITICFAGFHLTYYFLFFLFRYAQKYISQNIQHCFNNSQYN
jgi:hypothetical protein